MHDEHEIIKLEREAMARWCKGDPDRFLELSAPDVVYFDPTLEKRLDGHSALTTYYGRLRGKIFADRYEFIAPQVTATDDMAVLTYNFHSWGGSEDALRWHCTEVFRKGPGGWKIISTHWSFAAKLEA